MLSLFIHFIFFKNTYLFIYLAALGLSCNIQDVQCIMRDLFYIGMRVQLLQGIWDLSALPRD